MDKIVKAVKKVAAKLTSKKKPAAKKTTVKKPAAPKEKKPRKTAVKKTPSAAVKNKSEEVAPVEQIEGDLPKVPYSANVKNFGFGVAVRRLGARQIQL